MMMGERELHTLLRERFGLTAFRPGQWEALEAVLSGKRVLLVQPTGWGKSLVYQMLAAQKGLTLVFSPLRALMRDQVREAAKYRLTARVLNSDQSQEEQEQILKEASEGGVGLLYIAPERLDNHLWQQWFMKLPISALVIDEAHCISQWGHDFRPDYRRIVEVVRSLPPQTPVLAVTATATQRVIEDIRSQVGNSLLVMRGSLARDNLRLRVIQVSREAEKFAQVYTWVQRLPGTGLIYTATQASAEALAEFLREMGVNATFYHAKLPAEERHSIEENLMNNTVKVVTATNALGMGLNKPDIRFVIHAEFPGSLLAYYQEIGRAGRDGNPADIVLLYDPEDRKIQEHFINNSKPPQEDYKRVLTLLQKEALGENQILEKTGLAKTALRNILQDLKEQGLVSKMNGLYRTISSARPNFSALIEIRDAKEKELEKMIEYITTSQCRMMLICVYLGDETAKHCGQCDNCKKQPTPAVSESILTQAQQFIAHPKLHLRGTHGHTPIYQDGRALAYYSGTRVGEAIHRSKYEQDGQPFADWLVDSAVEVVRKYWPGVPFEGVVHVPSTRSGDLVKHFASKLASKLGLPHLDLVYKVRCTEPQKEFTNRVQKKNNLRNAFACRGRVPETLLVVDDVCDSGVTLEEVGRVLKKAGAKSLFALALAKTRHSDDL
ncbi:RecQ family ATP-dependent DNA helicase [Meiothermus sp. PNK-Is4]|nr:RecQ family ATP-dependent DNA helicase [Meiothermus sp. PNK-Is4]PZA06049.1 RecQ family ATP-dependent DNA helicase [Meiothermus sp. Pnk-1]RYM36155.1 RecQ family ATP-dependent DNA helicase [Meiothermus sp. PNK-Is4]